MKSFVAALLAALAVADGHAEWEPKAECLTYLDEQARWIQPRADVSILPKGKSAWTSEVTAAYDQILLAIKNIAAPAPLDDEARDGALELINDIDWTNTQGNDIQLSTQTDWPVYSGNFEADCVQPAPSASSANYDLKNSTEIVKAVKLNDGTNDVLEVTAVTGWVQHQGGSDAGIGYQIAADIKSEGSWDGQPNNSVSMVFGNDSTVTNLEYNEFQVINFSTAAKLIRVTYVKQNVDATNLTDLTGFAPLTDDREYIVSWRESKGNWTPGNPFNAEFGSNINTAGFWFMERAHTWLASGQTPSDPTRIVLVVEKETIGTVTTGIKAGGKIHGVIGYKSNNADTAFTAKTGVVEFSWAEEVVVPDDSGNTTPGGDGGNENEEDKDSATTMAAYGASILAAISALAF